MDLKHGMYGMYGMYGCMDVWIWTEQPDDVADVLMLTELVAAIAAKAVLQAVIVDGLPSESSENSQSVIDSSGIRDELSVIQNG